MAAATAAAAAAAAGASRKPRVLILGTGWGGNKLARKLKGSIFDVRVVSPANHFLFTSFLPSTAVGTLEFRAIQEPIRTCPSLAEYYQAKARTLDPEKQLLTCEDIFKKRQFCLPYDYLVIATGCKTNTFNTPGVAEREGQEVHYLKHLYHARQVRQRALECFERAACPGLEDEEIERLTSFVVVGGGPTSCEFATELHDFLRFDVARWYPDLAKRAKVTIVEAGPSILGAFDQALVDYYAAGLARKKISVKTGISVTAVKEYRETGGTLGTCAELADGSTLPFGLMVWSAGLAPVKFVNTLPFERNRGGRIIVDDYLRVPGTRGRIFAIGDCAATPTSQPPIASAAEQQGQYLADCFNMHYSSFDVTSERDVPLPGKVPAPVAFPFPRFLYEHSDKFRYISVGAMVAMGTGDGIVDMTKADLPKEKSKSARGKPTIRGILAMFMWRGGYLSKQLSWTNMILVPMFWMKSVVFGRDISRF